MAGKQCGPMKKSYLQLMTFSRIRMGASIPRESKRCNTDGRSDVWTAGETICWKLTTRIGQHRSLHHNSQPMNFSAHPKACIIKPNHQSLSLKTLFNIVEDRFIKCWTLMSVLLMMFKRVNKQPEIQKFWNWCSHYQEIYDWISPLNKWSGWPFILTQQSLGEMSMVNLVTCLLSLFWST